MNNKLNVLKFINSKKPTINSKKPTINSKKPTINSKKPTINSKKPIKNNIFSKEHIQNIFDKLKKNVKIIYNVFQPIYKNGVKTSGFGDFIRGYYFLMEFCEKKCFSCEFKINYHKITYFLKNYENSDNLPESISKEIIKFNNTNCNPLIDSFNTINNNGNKNIYDKFICFINGCSIFDNSIYINAYTYPNNEISLDKKEKMKIILEPTNLLMENIENALSNLLFNKYCYETIHIRFGDEYIIDESTKINNSKLKQAFNCLNNLDKTKNFLLLSDSNNLKKMIISKYPFVKTIFNEIVHTKNEDVDIENLKNTMLDFYLMSYSTNITAFSVYKYGSGFSEWCAKTYDIPYVCKYLN